MNGIKVHRLVQRFPWTAVLDDEMDIVLNRRCLNFNDELLAFDRDLWDYVIVHELLHFFVPNHGRLWKAMTRSP